MRRLLILMLTLSLSTLVVGEERLAIAFYDVGKLYDTTPSNFYDDKIYTPEGRNHWGEERYNRKLRNIVGVIDSMQMPIVALAGVENEEVVRDIVRLSNQDYSYLHRTIDYYDGLDFALLYYGDRIFPSRVYTTNHTMVIEAQIDQTTYAFHLTRVGSKLRTTKPLNSDSPAQITIAWGNISRGDLRRLDMEDILHKAELSGHGDSRGDYGWKFKNRIGVTSPKGHEIAGGVYITEWLLNSNKSAPLPTFSANRYYGGYSNYLPLYLYIKCGEATH